MSNLDLNDEMKKHVQEFVSHAMGKTAVNRRNAFIYVFDELSKLSLKTNKTLNELNTESESVALHVYCLCMREYIYSTLDCGSALEIYPEIKKDYDLLLHVIESYVIKINSDCDKPIRDQIDDLQIHFGYLEVCLFLFVIEGVRDATGDDFEWIARKIMSVKTEFNSKLNKILDDHSLDTSSKLTELEKFVDNLVYLNSNFHFYGDLRSEIGTLRDEIKKLEVKAQNELRADLERALKENSSNRVQLIK